MTTVKWWQHCQIQIGGQWQLVPSRSMGWKDWAWSPFGHFVYPGRKLTNPRAQLPEGELHGGLEDRNNGQGPSDWYSLVHWYSAGVRILGLDIGAGIFIRSKASVNKLTRKTNG